MSLAQIANYHRELEKTQRRGATSNEQSIKVHFANLLNYYAKKKKLTLVAELHYGNLRPDGTVRDDFLNDYGYWESKDTKDDLELEIKKKIAKGYPTTNIIFEDTKTVVLFQNGERVAEAKTINEKELDKLLKRFLAFELPQIQGFRNAVAAFKENIPKLAEALRKIIKEQEQNGNREFVDSRKDLIDICKQSINPEITKGEVNEMLVQHILTEDMFLYVFSEADFHRENNIAKAMDRVLRSFYTKKIKRNIKDKLGKFYLALKAKVGNINNLNEKQKVLKVAYEEFYKAYNPKGADRLGVVYTPNEIVNFMIESTDYICRKHFGKSLADKGVDILDPATGTGTFITSLLDFIPKYKRAYKYKNEIHCNELAILPYYIANLNIEYTYQMLMQEYEPFENIVLTDTLDNATGLRYAGKQTDFFSMSEENTVRIKRQNERKISVIIGNPPYNANQQNFNDFNANRKYPTIDERIKTTFSKESAATNKANIYDMYVRFYRWAMDRIGNEGVIAFVTNRSFINASTFDGFRKYIKNNFNDVYVIDTQSDVRKNPKIAGTTHNIFGIQTGVAIMFLIKKKIARGFCNIHYFTLKDEMLKDEKLTWLTDTKFYDIPFEYIKPSKKNNWINIANDDFDELIPLMDREVKAGKTEQAIFKLYSLGVNTNRDEWVYDFNKKALKAKIIYFTNYYNNLIKQKDTSFPTEIKWSPSLKHSFQKNIKSKYKYKYIVKSGFRPFTKKYHYSEKLLNHRLTDAHYRIFGSSLTEENLLINFNSSEKDSSLLASNLITDLHFIGDSQCLPFYTYDKNGNRYENITNWGLTQFTAHYKDTSITKLDIFHYAYAVLHHPNYRKKYELNLKREFPRLPFYKDFRKWVSWGKSLMNLHIEYETVEPYPLKQIDNKIKKGTLIVPKMKANKEDGIIILDSKTELQGVPPRAWTYKLGNRSALEWILDQYKEKKIRDKTLREQFNTYRFADYKKQVIDLLQRVCTVSVETMSIVEEMEKTPQT